MAHVLDAPAGTGSSRDSSLPPVRGACYLSLAAQPAGSPARPNAPASILAQRQGLRGPECASLRVFSGGIYLEEGYNVRRYQIRDGICSSIMREDSGSRIQEPVEVNHIMPSSIRN